MAANVTVGVALARRQHGELRMFALAVLGSLLLSPLVWGHYFVLLLPLVAIANPRMAIVWLVPSGLYLVGDQWSAPSTLHIAISLAIMCLMTVPALGMPRLTLTRPLRLVMLEPRMRA